MGRRPATWPWSNRPRAASIQRVPLRTGSTRAPAGVVSSTQASTSSTGRPSSATGMQARMAHAGASKAGKAMLAPCTASQATTA